MRILTALALCSAALAQNTPWTSTVRGSWVQTGAAAAGDVTLAAPGRVCQIVVAANEDTAVHQAAEFLAGDIESISGRRPAIVASATPGAAAIHLVTLGNRAIPPAVNANVLQGQWESYRVVTDGNDVWLVGSNPRGTAFASYTLSERLGIDPIYIWTGYRPEHRDPLILKRTAFSQAPPAFRYRGFFHDDEDLLPRPFDANGDPLQTGDVPLEWYKRFFETALRLRMNMVAPYTRVHRRYEVQKLASDWGLYYTSHHYDILLSNPWGLTRFNLAQERGVRPDYDWFTNREGMLKFWLGGVTENKDLDVIWPVGMRGTQDRAFTFPQGFTEDQKAATFRDVIGEQVKMVRAAVPEGKTPLFHFTMYSEMLPAYQRNPAAFDLPDDVMIIWPDDNDGHMRGLPTSLGKWKHGVYYHLAYLGGNLSKQTTHTETPAVIAREFQKIVKAGATQYMLVNVSELRDYVMGARMIADITWDAPSIFSSANSAQRYTNWWSREYFGRSASAAESVYGKYFELINRPDHMWAAMNNIQDLIAALYKKVQGEKPGASLSADALAQLQARGKLLDQALAEQQKVQAAMPASQQRFFSIDTGIGLEVVERQTSAALKLDQALRAPDSARMWQLVGDAQASLEQLEIELMRGEYPPFDRWYAQSWIRSAQSANNPHRAYTQLRAFISSEGHGSLGLPAPATR